LLWTTAASRKGCGFEVFDLRREIRVWLGN
jgi:hypothetical protein